MWAVQRPKLSLTSRGRYQPHLGGAACPHSKCDNLFTWPSPPTTAKCVHGRRNKNRASSVPTSDDYGDSRAAPDHALKCVPTYGNMSFVCPSGLRRGLHQNPVRTIRVSCFEHGHVTVEPAGEMRQHVKTCAGVSPTRTWRTFLFAGIITRRKCTCGR